MNSLQGDPSSRTQKEKKKLQVYENPISVMIETPFPNPSLPNQTIFGDITFCNNAKLELIR